MILTSIIAQPAKIRCLLPCCKAAVRLCQEQQYHMDQNVHWGKQEEGPYQIYDLPDWLLLCSTVYYHFPPPPSKIPGNMEALFSLACTVVVARAACRILWVLHNKHTCIDVLGCSLVSMQQCVG
jgi:hypothetical protein